VRVGRLLAAVMFIAVFAPAGVAARDHGEGGTVLVQFDDARVATLDVGTGRVRALARGSGAAWSPDGRNIALSRSGDLVVLSADGRHARQLTHDELIQFEPVWSPDGTRIAFLQQHGEPQLGVGPQDDVAVADLATGATRRLTSDVRSKATLSWSPEGTQLVYENVGRPSPRPLVVIDAASGTIVEPASFRPYPLWSPRGLRIAYVTVDGERCSLVLINADGSSPHVLFRGPRGIGLFDVTWSPDGRSLAFVLGGWSSNRSRIEVADIASGRVRAVTAPNSHDSAPSWSPDSRRIVFARYEPAQKRYAVAVVDRTGRNLRVLLRSSHFAQPLWRPRGN
jgi:Tol biopolymer transport system component